MRKPIGRGSRPRPPPASTGSWPVQNDDGGWPTFRRSPRRASRCDGSGADLTRTPCGPCGRGNIGLRIARIDEAIRRGMQLPGRPAAVRWKLAAAVVRQSEFSRRGEPDLRHLAGAPGVSAISIKSKVRGPARLEWLAAAVDPGGGWGGGGHHVLMVARVRGPSSVEETALAVEALLAAPGDPPTAPCWKRGWNGSSGRSRSRAIVRPPPSACTGAAVVFRKGLSAGLHGFGVRAGGKTPAAIGLIAESSPRLRLAGRTDTSSGAIRQRHSGRRPSPSPSQGRSPGTRFRPSLFRKDSPIFVERKLGQSPTSFSTRP